MSKQRNRKAVQLDPLDYILRVIGDPTASLARRDRLALAALPYCHARLPEPAKVRVRPLGKRELAARAAGRAFAGEGNGEWGDDLRIDD